MRKPTHPNWRARARLGLGLIILTGLLMACGSGATPPPPPPLKLAYDLWPGYYPALIAQDQGFFAEAGVAVELIAPGNSTAMQADLLGGKYDAVAVSLGDMVSLLNTDSGVKVVLFSDESAGGDAFLVTGDIQTIADLKGQTIGVDLGGFAEVFVATALEQNGVQHNDVNWVDSDASQLPGKFLSGELQAGHSWEPFVAEAVANGARVLFTSADTPGLVLDGVMFRGDVVKNRPDDVRAFVQAWFRAVDYWQADPAAGNAAAARVLNVDPSTVSLDGIDLKTLADNVQLFTSGNTFASARYTAQVYVGYFLRTGVLTTRLDTDLMLDDTFLK